MMKILNTRENLNNEVLAIKTYAKRYGTQKNKALVYNLSLGNLFQSIIARFRGKKIYWYRHECTTFLEKLENNNFFYAVLTILGEIAFSLISTKICTGSPLTSKKYKIDFCPLLKPVISSDKHERDIDILYFGREDPRRSPQLLASLKKNTNFKIVQAGGPENRVTEQEKTELFRRAKIVLNRYTNSIGQSGVTPEALSYGCVVIISEYDYVSNICELQNNFFLIKSYISDDSATKMIRTYIKNFDFVHNSASVNRIDKYFGRQAFENYWAPFLDLR